MLSGHKLSWLTLAFILCLYLLFPSGLSTTDAWYYAASVRYRGEILNPHHLLYNVLGLTFSWLPSKLGFETISCLKVMNALFAIMVLVVLQQILYSFKLSGKQVIITTCLAGLSFGILRYATENETYIVPLLFGLLASYSYLRFILSGKTGDAFLAGLWAGVSVLFHQIYIFWWLGILIGIVPGKNKKPALTYLAISLIVPVIYLLAIFIISGQLSWNSIQNFMLGDFRENVRIGLTGKGILLSFINLIRSFIQVHGYLFNMIKAKWFITIPGVISLIFVILAFLKIPVRNAARDLKSFIVPHIIIIILQFFFAMLSSGNAEFMVMIPILIFMLIPLFVSGYEQFLLRLLVALAIWNISYGLIPLHFKSQAPEQFICEKALSGGNIIVAADDQLIKSMLYYQTGNNNMNCIFKSPGVIAIKYKSPEILNAVIDSALSRMIPVYTNCLDEATLSRASIIEGSRDKEFFQKYEMTLTKSWRYITGTRAVYKVERKL